MNTQQVKIGKREQQVWEYIAWGASLKETANLLGISYRTVDNTVRKLKLKLRLQKVTELSAYWFCTHFNISFDLSPLVKKAMAISMIVILAFSEKSFSTPIYVRRTRRAHIEVRLPVYAQTFETSSS